jgi:A/G-specific adenine glycosylase
MNKKLLQWSKQFDSLPWRRNRTLYSTLVSEIMLQQTTVGTVLNHFEKFMKEYPTLESLAQASEEQLTISWKGLGYYRRARNLKKACEFIVNEFHGEIPLDFETLINIPGIGPYTASALIAIGADKPALAVDANLERVLARYYGIKIEKGPKLQKEIAKLFSEKKIAKNIKALGPREYNEALMDLGRNYCQARKAACDLCPINSKCFAFNKAKPLDYPIVKEVKKESFELDLLRVIVKKGNKLLAYKKSKGEWLEGQWEVPTFIMKSQDKKLSQYPKTRRKPKADKIIKTGITKYKISNHIIEMDYKEFTQNYPGEYKFTEVQASSNLASSTSKFLK